MIVFVTNIVFTTAVKLLHQQNDHVSVLVRVSIILNVQTLVKAPSETLLNLPLCLYCGYF